MCATPVVDEAVLSIYRLAWRKSTAHTRVGPSTPTETSAMLSTKQTLGLRHRSGSGSASGCGATPNPGPEVRGSPSVWYFACPIAFSRLASVSA
jgi:hypothetical protein